MLINEIPIEVRKIRGVTPNLLRKYLIKWSGISSSTNLRLCVAYPHIKHNTAEGYYNNSMSIICGKSRWIKITGEFDNLQEMPIITELLSRTCDYNAHFSQPISGSISLVFNSPFLIESFIVFLEKSAFS